MKRVSSALNSDTQSGTKIHFFDRVATPPLLHITPPRRSVQDDSEQDIRNPSVDGTHV